MNGAQERIGLLFMPNCGSCGVLGEHGVSGIDVVGSVEPIKGAAGGGNIETAFRPQFLEERDDVVIVLPGAEFENEMAVLLGM